MMPTRLLRKSLYTVQHQSWRALIAKARRKLFPLNVHRPVRRKSYASEALTLAERFDFTPADLQRSHALAAANQGPLPIRTVNWHLPHFEHAAYGGLHTILRFSAGMAQRHGVESRFVIRSTIAPQAAFYAGRIRDVFPQLAAAQVLVQRGDADLQFAPPADVCVASLWTTAYDVLKFNQTKRKVYVVQDYEPLFYPAGSMSALAEATYRFGFYGLANTVTLKQLYEEHGAGRAMAFQPCVDTDLFYPAHSPTRAAGECLTVFFYGRPDVARNGFELAATALRQLKTRLGSRVRIVAAGQNWNPADYGLAGVVENKGLLSYGETAALYRTCDVGLALMFTRHPSYLPFELMASGCLVVSNANNATAWLLADGQNCLLSLPSASCIADVMARGLLDTALRRRIAADALAMIRRQFADWDAQVDRVYEYMCDPERYLG